jgi:hypothetical protein
MVHRQLATAVLSESPQIVTERVHLYHYLEEMHGIFMTGERHKIRAQNLSVREAKKFALNEGAAVLVVEGTGFTEVNFRSGIRSSTTAAIDMNWKTKSTPAAGRPGSPYGAVLSVTPAGCLL